MDDRASLLAQAARCRRLADDILDDRAELALLALATEYEARAAALDDPAAATDATTATLELASLHTPCS